MKIELHEVPIQDIVKYSMHLNECQGYEDREEEGVYGMEGRLNVRPPYQREFIYKNAQRNAVVKTIKDGRPLNTLYWVLNKDGTYEVLDGQQRIISICQYVLGDFSINDVYFKNLTEDQKEQILNYKLLVYFCDGTDSEKLEWFETINIAGEKLSDQELRNAVYYGPWLGDAKRYFSRTGGPAYQIASDYLKGTAIRQVYLETAIKWINDGNIEDYMAKHQHDEDAVELWDYFNAVIDWVNKLFPKYRKEMKGVAFGPLFNEYRANSYNPDEIEKEVASLMIDEDVSKKAGIYSYIFTRSEKDLSIRIFTDGQKREAYERQKGICIHCSEHFELEDMEADHITPWSKGGKTLPENCQMLCVGCNRTKSNK
ncbi:MAG: HNH endonuclease [Candidatus Asgardarchaeum californiense]|nr:MAG: HNH endonuclease [Candidatus Asgardarchaeum californiense]